MFTKVCRVGPRSICDGLRTAKRKNSNRVILMKSRVIRSRSLRNNAIRCRALRRFTDGAANKAPSTEATGGGSGSGKYILMLAAGGAGYYFYMQRSGMPEIKSKHSLVHKYLTPKIYQRLKDKKTATSGSTLDACIACAVQFDDQHCGIYAGDQDCYVDFGELFDPIIKDYHSFDGKHISNMNVEDIKGNIDNNVPVNSTRIRVGRNIEGFGLSPGILREHRLEVEELMKGAFNSFDGDLAGTYYPLTGMDEATRYDVFVCALWQLFG